MRKALAEHPHVGEVRGEGMLCAVELVEARQGRTFFESAGQQGPKVAAALLKRGVIARAMRSVEHTSELQSLMRISYAVFCLKKKKKTQQSRYSHNVYIISSRLTQHN